MASKAPQIPLPDLPQALRSQGTDAPYMTCWRGIIEGKIPAQRRGGRWVVNTSDLDDIAATLARQAG